MLAAVTLKVYTAPLILDRNVDKPMIDLTFLFSPPFSSPLSPPPLSSQVSQSSKVETFKVRKYPDSV